MVRGRPASLDPTAAARAGGGSSSTYSQHMFTSMTERGSCRLRAWAGSMQPREDACPGGIRTSRREVRNHLLLGSSLQQPEKPIVDPPLPFPDIYVAPPLRPLEDTPTAWVDSSTMLDSMVQRLKHAAAVAIDTEHSALLSYTGSTCLMQISTGTADFLVDTLALRDELGPALAPLLADPSILKVLHGCANDLIWLQRDFGLHLSNVFDTEKAAAALGLEERSLGALLQRYYGVTQDKRHQTADWSARPLAPELVTYARSDVHWLRHLAWQLQRDLLAASGITGGNSGAAGHSSGSSSSAGGSKQSPGPEQQAAHPSKDLSTGKCCPALLSAVLKSQALTQRAYQPTPATTAVSNAASAAWRRFQQQHQQQQQQLGAGVGPATGHNDAGSTQQQQKQQQHKYLLAAQHAVAVLVAWRDHAARTADMGCQHVLPETVLLDLAARTGASAAAAAAATAVQVSCTSTAAVVAAGGAADASNTSTAAAGVAGGAAGAGAVGGAAEASCAPTPAAGAPAAGAAKACEGAVAVHLLPEDAAGLVAVAQQHLNVMNKPTGDRSPYARRHVLSAPLQQQAPQLLQLLQLVVGGSSCSSPAVADSTLLPELQAAAAAVGAGACGATSFGQLRRKQRSEAQEAEFRARMIKKFSAKKVVYENCRMLSQEGELLCYCDARKLEWYVQKGLGQLVAEDPPTIQLLFEHKNTDQQAGLDGFYSTSKSNQCVVCGNSTHYLRYRVVPSCYRRCFPPQLKSHRSHDIVLLCFDCHQVAHKASEKMKQQLADEYAVPLRITAGPGVSGGSAAAGVPAGEAEDGSIAESAAAAAAAMQVRAAAIALHRFGENIPEQRRRELEHTVKLYTRAGQTDGQSPVIAGDMDTPLTQQELETGLLIGLGPKKRELMLRKLRGHSHGGRAAQRPRLAKGSKTAKAAAEGAVAAMPADAVGGTAEAAVAAADKAAAATEAAAAVAVAASAAPQLAAAGGRRPIVAAAATAAWTDAQPGSQGTASGVEQSKVDHTHSTGGESSSNSSDGSSSSAGSSGEEESQPPAAAAAAATGGKRHKQQREVPKISYPYHRPVAYPTAAAAGEGVGDAGSGVADPQSAAAGAAGSSAAAAGAGAATVPLQLSGHQWHGEQVVAAALRVGGEDALHDLVRRFRRCFVEALRPQHLPRAWDVDSIGQREFGEYSVYRGEQEGAAASGSLIPDVA